VTGHLPLSCVGGVAAVIVGDAARLATFIVDAPTQHDSTKQSLSLAPEESPVPL
jgi:hypothetical protein